jgi:hypothetical protein
MNRDAPLTEFEFASGEQRGARLALHGNRLVQWGGDATETVVLAQIASVRVAFERDGHKLAWGLALGAAALALFLAFGPLQRWLGGGAGRAGDAARADALDGFLQGVLNAFGLLASLLPGVAAALAVVAATLLAYFWLGRTTLTLAFGATERVFSVRGRNRQLVAFGEAVGERLAARAG